MEESKISRRGEHKKRKKSGRKHFYQTKNKFRSRSIETSQQPTEDHDTIDHELPKDWKKLGDGKYCKLEEGSYGLVQVTMSLLVEPDSNVTVFAAGKKVPETSDLLPLCCSNEEEVIAAVKAIDKAALCPGNPDETRETLSGKSEWTRV